MRFSEIKGHKQLKGTIAKIVVENKVSHAMLFTENEGGGALPIALATAAFITCKNRGVNDSCGVCPSCNKISKLIHPDLHFALPVNTSSTTSEQKPTTDTYIGKWRDALLKNPYITESEWYATIGIEDKRGLIGVAESQSILKKLSLISYEGGEKFMIIWLPERMNRECSNKLLKILEEPTAGTYFMLITQSPDKLLSTVLSRCQIIPVKPEDPDVLAELLKEEFNLNKEDAKMWAKVSLYSYGNAVNLIKGSDNQTLYKEVLIKLIDRAISKDLVAVLDSSEDIISLGKERQKEFCIYSLNLIRKFYVTKLGLPQISNVEESQRVFIEKYAEMIPLLFLEKSTIIFNKALEDLERNVNPKFIFSDLTNRFFVSL